MIREFLLFPIKDSIKQITETAKTAISNPVAPFAASSIAAFAAAGFSSVSPAAAVAAPAHSKAHSEFGRLVINPIIPQIQAALDFFVQH